ncbi:hypothetical protein LSAT2_018803 [Lamellibrachia satsuma]|nr:hypothetical protein LSAT2_018803 [Lamellibrachia satsuma]
MDRTLVWIEHWYGSNTGMVEPGMVDLDAKQNAIRVLVKQNLASQTKLESHQTEVLKYLKRTVCGDSNVTAQLSKQLRDSIIKEVDSFSAHVQPMPIFTVMDSAYKITTADLSINRFHGNRDSSTGQYLEKVLRGVDFPHHQAPECLLLQVMDRLNEGDELQLTLTRCGRLAVDTGRENSDGCCLLRHMKDVRRQVAEHDKKQLETLVPLLEKHVSLVPKALSACLQLQDTAAKWWDQPAQHCVVNCVVDNMTLQQWTERWTLAVTQLRQLQLQH